MEDLFHRTLFYSYLNTCALTQRKYIIEICNSNPVSEFNRVGLWLKTFGIKERIEHSVSVQIKIIISYACPIKADLLKENILWLYPINRTDAF